MPAQWRMCTFEIYKPRTSSACNFVQLFFCKGILIITQHSAWDKVKQGSLNKLMHILNGNTRVVLSTFGSEVFGRAVLLLDDLIPNHNVEDNPHNTREGRKDCCYSKKDMLYGFVAQKDPHFVPPLTTTRSVCTADTAATPKRTGRRIQITLPTGEICFRKRDEGCKRPRIREFTNSSHSRTPPPRGAPGAFWSHEGCPPKGLGTKEGLRGPRTGRSSDGHTGSGVGASIR